MKQKEQASRLVDFINKGVLEQLNYFADAGKNGIGNTIAQKIKETQIKLFESKFTSIEKLLSIKGLEKKLFE